MWQQWLKEETKDTRTSKSAVKKNHFNYKPKVTRLVRIKLSGERKDTIHQENSLYSLPQKLLDILGKKQQEHKKVKHEKQLENSWRTA